MKKFYIAALIVSLAFCGACITGQEAWADSQWDQFVAQMDNQSKIKNSGEIVTQLAAQAPQVSSAELWKLSCSAPTPQQQASASLALVARLFPDGDPSQWQQVSGFFPPSSYVPTQLVAVNALFNAVTAMTQMPEAVFGAAWLMNRFSQSSAGMLTFIDNMPQHFRTTMNSLIAQTGLQGIWTSSTIEGPWPFVPVFEYTITDSIAFSNNYQFLNGFGQLAGFGSYAWDRARGNLYKVVSGGEGNSIFMNN